MEDNGESLTTHGAGSVAGTRNHRAPGHPLDSYLCVLHQYYWEIKADRVLLEGSGISLGLAAIALVQLILSVDLSRAASRDADYRHS